MVTINVISKEITFSYLLFGNTPRKGDILSWSESSAVVFANSVIGARTNRNSGVIELLCGVIGKVPEFGKGILAKEYNTYA